MTRMVRVNSLPVAKRWYKTMQEERHPLARKRIGIWELKVKGSTVYRYSSAKNYVVGNSLCVETKISNLGDRIA